MDRYIDIMKKYLAEHTPDYGTPLVYSLLEFLWLEYGERNIRENDAIKEDLAILGAFIDRYPRKEADVLSGAVCSACAEYKRQGFLEGARVGMRLAVELAAVE